MATLEPANHRDRVAATGVDLLLVLLLGAGAATVTGGASGSIRLGAILFAIGLPTFLVEGVLGRSLGKAGLQLRHTRSGGDDPALGVGPSHGGSDHALSIPRAVARYVLKWLVPTALVVVGLWLAALAWWVALYLPALGPRHRAAHDRLTRTAVLGPTERPRAEGR